MIHKAGEIAGTNKFHFKTVWKIPQLISGQCPHFIP